MLRKLAILGAGGLLLAGAAGIAQMTGADTTTANPDTGAQTGQTANPTAGTRTDTGTYGAGSATTGAGAAAGTQQDMRNDAGTTGAGTYEQYGERG